jgi:hypothetical protein
VLSGGRAGFGPAPHQVLRAGSRPYREGPATGLGGGRRSAGRCRRKYTASLFGKLGILDDGTDNRRVLAVLPYLNKD